MLTSKFTIYSDKHYAVNSLVTTTLSWKVIIIIISIYIALYQGAATRHQWNTISERKEMLDFDVKNTHCVKITTSVEWLNVFIPSLSM